MYDIWLKMIFQQASVDLNWRFFNVLIALHIWKAFSDALELMIAAYSRKNAEKNT